MIYKNVLTTCTAAEEYCHDSENKLYYLAIIKIILKKNFEILSYNVIYDIMYSIYNT